MDDSISVGTGFFVSKEGDVATCWHVVASRLSVDERNGRILSKIQIELNNGAKYNVGIHNYYINKGNKDAQIYDYCLLVITDRIKSAFDYYNLGSFETVNEGDYVYSCGYPLGIQQQFISSGIFSTKWKDSIKWREPNAKNQLDTIQTFNREVAWMDLTLNRGNSGGPIILFGNNPKDDFVIGISSFILNPYAKPADEILIHNSRFRNGGGSVFDGISANKVNSLFAEAIAYNSIGISGCISIDYLKKTLK